MSQVFPYELEGVAGLLLRGILSHSCLLWSVSKNTRLEGWKKERPPVTYPIAHAEPKLAHVQEAGDVTETIRE